MRLTLFDLGTNLTYDGSFGAELVCKSVTYYISALDLIRTLPLLFCKTFLYCSDSDKEKSYLGKSTSVA